jgi:hypothetical protein
MHCLIHWAGQHGVPMHQVQHKVFPKCSQLEYPRLKKILNQRPIILSVCSRTTLHNNMEIFF